MAGRGGLDAKIVIVGAGIIGTSVAYHLTLRGARSVTLVDNVGLCPARVGGRRAASSR